MIKMKNLKKILFMTIIFITTPSLVKAGSVSVRSSATYVTVGSQVTFYVYGNNVASWNLSGSGTGALAGCSFRDSDASSNAENITKTIKSVTCTATNLGQAAFTITGDISYLENGTMKTTGVNSSKIIVVQKPREKDTNNYLKALEVKGYTLSPAFNKETLEYSVNVPSTVNKVTLDAALESGYASLTGTGEFEVNEGVNTFEINVTSETGVARSYKVVINVADENPIHIEIDGNAYTVMKNAKTLEKPRTYEETTIKIKDFDIPAFHSEKTGFTLIGVKDTKGTTHFAISKENAYELYNENKAGELLLYIEKITDEKDGFTKQKATINSSSYDVLISAIDKNTMLVKAMNINTGDVNFYRYDEKEGTYQIYNDTIENNLQEEIKKYQDVVLYLCIGLGVALFFILILIFTRPKKKKQRKIEEIKIEKLEIEEEAKEAEKEEPKTKKKKKKKMKKQKNNPMEEKNQEEINETPKNVAKNEVKKIQNLSKEEALKQVSKAADIIEEYEKTMKISKKELEKKKKELEQKEIEETMYDIFEDDKKKKKK